MSVTVSKTGRSRWTSPPMTPQALITDRATRKPNTFAIMSFTAAFPLVCCVDISTCQIAAVTVFAPLPMPAMTRPIVRGALFQAPACSAIPMAMTIVERKSVRFRPNRSPRKIAAMVPRPQLRS